MPTLNPMSIMIAFLFSTLLLLGCANPELLLKQSPNEEILYVGPEQVDCIGVVPQQCLQVKHEPNDGWELFYDSIAGFDYEAGFTYELRVRVSQVVNPPADASNLRYELIEVVAKTASDTPATIQASLSNETWHLSEMNAKDRTETVPTNAGITLQFEGDQVTGSAGCNAYFASYKHNESLLTIGPIGSTRKACGGEIDQREFTFLSMLAEVAEFEASETELTLIDGTGTARLTFTRAGK